MGILVKNTMKFKRESSKLQQQKENGEITTEEFTNRYIELYD